MDRLHSCVHRVEGRGEERDAAAARQRDNDDDADVDVVVASSLAAAHTTTMHRQGLLRLADRLVRCPVSCTSRALVHRRSFGTAEAETKTEVEQLRARIDASLEQHRKREAARPWKWYHRLMGLTSRKPTLIRAGHTLYNTIEAASSAPSLVAGTLLPAAASQRPRHGLTPPCRSARPAAREGHQHVVPAVDAASVVVLRAPALRGLERRLPVAGALQQPLARRRAPRRWLGILLARSRPRSLAQLASSNTPCSSRTPSC